MPPPATHDDAESDASESNTSGRHASSLDSSQTGTIAKAEDRNFLLLVVYQVVMRCGWIFKTESIIMPAVLDMISGAAWVRGILPILNRIGQSIPPLLYARRLTITPKKKWSVASTTFAMGFFFFALALLFVPSIRAWLESTHSILLALLFLLFYALFFAATGLNQLGFGTLQGKLIEAHHRGRLMLTANVTGAILAIMLAAYLLPIWMTDQEVQVHWIFGFAAITFFLSSFVAMLLQEPADHYDEPKVHVFQLLRNSLTVLSTDHNFRRLAFIGGCFGCSLMLFPHYQAIAREKLDIPLTQLIYWVMVQNAGTAMVSLLAGPLADRKGNRVVLQIFMLGILLLPIGAMGLIYLGSAAANWFNLLFLCLGVVPITFRTFTNYTLETANKSEHPRYLATLSLCIAAPVIFSPLVGWLIDLTSFELMFSLIAAIVFAGWLVTFTLEEPRHGPTSE
ncbi:MAG: MFS transporter [Pirellulales bacterium]